MISVMSVVGEQRKAKKKTREKEKANEPMKTTAMATGN